MAGTVCVVVSLDEPSAPLVASVVVGDCAGVVAVATEDVASVDALAVADSTVLAVVSAVCCAADEEDAVAAERAASAAEWAASAAEWAALPVALSLVGDDVAGGSEVSVDDVDTAEDSVDAAVDVSLEAAGGLGVGVSATAGADASADAAG